MDLDFSPEQELLGETVRGLCTRHLGLDQVRRWEDDPVGYSEPFWAALGESGITGLTLPERLGGSGMTLLDGVIVYQEFGRALAPSPHFVSSVISGEVIAAAGTESQQADWVPRIASGEAIVTAAWLEPGGGFGPAGIALEAVPDGSGGWLLSGTKRHVAFATAATALLVLARMDGEIAFLLVDPATDGISATQEMSLSSDTQYRLDFDRVAVPSQARLGDGRGDAWQVWDEVMHRGIVLLAAQAVGGAHYAHEITTQYAKDRFQFDKPLGAFQAIGHYLADAITAIDGAETLVWEAGWAATVGMPISRLAPVAKLFAADTFRDVTAMAQQVFGGVGFTVEYDIQLYFRRAKQLQISWWDARYLEELIAADVLA